jgi:hypothetical protein
MVKVIQMDDKLFNVDEILFNWMKIVKLNEYTHCNLEPTMFGMFGVGFLNIPKR